MSLWSLSTRYRHQPYISTLMWDISVDIKAKNTHCGLSSTLNSPCWCCSLIIVPDYMTYIAATSHNGAMHNRSTHIRFFAYTIQSVCSMCKNHLTMCLQLSQITIYTGTHLHNITLHVTFHAFGKARLDLIPLFYLSFCQGLCSCCLLTVWKRVLLVTLLNDLLLAG